jgi:hypothetical protein
MSICCVVFILLLTVSLIFCSPQYFATFDSGNRRTLESWLNSVNSYSVAYDSAVSLCLSGGLNSGKLTSIKLPFDFPYHSLYSQLSLSPQGSINFGRLIYSTISLNSLSSRWFYSSSYAPCLSSNLQTCYYSLQTCSLNTTHFSNSIYANFADFDLSRWPQYKIDNGITGSAVKSGVFYNNQDLDKFTAAFINVPLRIKPNLPSFAQIVADSNNNLPNLYNTAFNFIVELFPDSGIRLSYYNLIDPATLYSNLFNNANNYNNFPENYYDWLVGLRNLPLADTDSTRNDQWRTTRNGDYPVRALLSGNLTLTYCAMDTIVCISPRQSNSTAQIPIILSSPGLSCVKNYAHNFVCRFSSGAPIFYSTISDYLSNISPHNSIDSPVLYDSTHDLVYCRAPISKEATISLDLLDLSANLFTSTILAVDSPLQFVIDNGLAADYYVGPAISSNNLAYYLGNLCQDCSAALSSTASNSTNPLQFCGEIDCAGHYWGSAVLDECGECVEGSTGHQFNANLTCSGVCLNVLTPSQYISASGQPLCPGRRPQNFVLGGGGEKLTPINNVMESMKGYHWFLVAVSGTAVAGAVCWSTIQAGRKLFGAARRNFDVEQIPQQ